jgi:DNA polymerase V
MDDDNVSPEGLLPGTRRASIGFAAVVDSFHENRLDLNKYLIRHPAATFFVRVRGNAMAAAGIHSGDILIVDRSLPVDNQRIVVAVVNGEFMVRRFHRKGHHALLLSDSDHYAPIRIKESEACDIWGVAVAVIHQLRAAAL